MARGAKGARRIHKKPNDDEIRACRPWLDAEIALVKPEVILCLGATAAQALLGKQLRVTKQRGKPVPSPPVPALVHGPFPALPTIGYRTHRSATAPARPAPPPTLSTMYQDAIAHLKACDPTLASIIDRVGPCRFEPRTRGTHLEALMRSIIYQQLSGRAAATIHRRFVGLHGGRSPSARRLLATRDDALRGAGVSRQKIGYLRDLAARVEARELPVRRLHELTDDEIIESLVRVKGIGRWTAHMFLIFRLGRPDVLPDLDLGIQKAIKVHWRKRKLPTPIQVAKLGAPWAPCRTIASWYLWRSIDTAVP